MVPGAKALAQSMCKVIPEPSLIWTMGRKSRALAEQTFDVNRVNESILGVMLRAC